LTVVDGESEVAEVCDEEVHDVWILERRADITDDAESLVL